MSSTFRPVPKSPNTSHPGGGVGKFTKHANVVGEGQIHFLPVTDTVPNKISADSIESHAPPPWCGGSVQMHTPCPPLSPGRGGGVLIRSLNNDFFECEKNGSNGDPFVRV